MSYLLLIVSSREFVAALGGAGSAFLLEGLRRWWSDNTTKQTEINLALVSLVQMFGVLKDYSDQVFVVALPALKKSLGRDPLPMEYKAAVCVPELGLRIRYEELAVLLRTNDPDLLNRLLRAEQLYQSGRAGIDLHVKLQQEFLRRATEQGLRGQSTIEEIRKAVGADLYAQLNDLVTSLMTVLPEDSATIAATAKRLRAVARMHFPTRRFGDFITGPANTIADATTRRPPALWRRLIRWIVDLLRNEKYRRTIPWLLLAAVLAIAASMYWPSLCNVIRRHQ